MSRLMKTENITIWVSIIALVLGIISICIAAWRTPELSFDYQGVIVGVLSLLVTVLIGWNIYTLIDIKNTKDKIDEISSGSSLMIQKSMALSENTNWMIYHYLLLKEDPLGLEYRFLYHGVACLFHTSQFYDIATCNVLVKGLLECITNPEKIIINENSKNDVLKLISGVKHPEKIEGFFELMNKIALVRVK